MKYSQYHKIRQIMESDIAQSYGYDINEWESLSIEEKIDQVNELHELFPYGNIESITLNESPVLGAWSAQLASMPGAGIQAALGSLGPIGLGAGVAALALGILFRKKIKNKFKTGLATRRLRREVSKFKNQALGGMEKAMEAEIKAKEEIKQSEGVEKWTELPPDKKRKLELLDIKIAKLFSNYIEEVSAIKARQIKKYIDGRKIKDSSKDALRFTWATLVLEVKVALLKELMERAGIETASGKKYANSLVQNDVDKLKAEGEEILAGADVGGDEPSSFVKPSYSGPALRGGLI